MRWVFGLLASCVLLMLLAMVLIANWDWNSARPWVAQQVSKSTGREFRIEGDLSADWHWPQPLEQGFTTAGIKMGCNFIEQQYRRRAAQFGYQSGMGEDEREQKRLLLAR